MRCRYLRLLKPGTFMRRQGTSGRRVTWAQNFCTFSLLPVGFPVDDLKGKGADHFRFK